jgi:hypothetical protein
VEEGEELGVDRGESVEKETPPAKQHSRKEKYVFSRWK